MHTAVLSLALTAGLLLPAGSEQVRSFSETFDTDGASSVMLDVPLGEVEIVGSAGTRIEVDVVLECGRGWGSGSCPERAENIELVSRHRGGRLIIEVDGYSKWRNRGLEVNVKVRVPAQMKFELDMGIGEVEIRDMTGDISVDMGIGEVTLRMSADDVDSVNLDTGIGEASLRTPSGNSEAAGLFANEVAWKKGNGEATIKVDLGIGEIDVRLR